MRSNVVKCFLSASILIAGGGMRSVSGQPLPSRLTLQNPGDNAAMMVHRNAFGKPCLNIEAASRAHVINPRIYDNVISIQNQCSKLISLRVCYYGTDICVDIEVPGQQRKDTTLGVRPNSQYFHYSYKEKF